MGYFSTLEQRGSHPSNPEAWFIRGAGGPENSSGVHVDQESALSSSAVLQGVRLVSETVGRVPLGIFRRLDRGRELLRDHPAHRTLSEPNPEVTAIEVRSMVQGFAVTAGVGYAQIVFDAGGRPAELWPIPPHRVIPERAPETQALRFRVKAEDGTEALVPMENMLVVPGFQRGGLLGVDVVKAMQESIGLTLATERFGGAFFGNGTVFSGFLRSPKQIGKDAKTNIRESLERKHQGVDRSHRIGFLEEGLEWIATGVPPEAAQFLETRKFQVDEVARILNVPPHLLWHLERATFNNIEELGIAFVVYSLGSWWVRWEQRVAQRLLLPSERMAGLYAKHNANELLRGSPEKRGGFYREMFNMGAASPNDIREWEDLNPVEGGDVYLVPMNMIPADQAALGAQDDEPPPEPDDEEGDEREVRRALAASRLRQVHERLFLATAEGVVRREASLVRSALNKSSGGRDLARLCQEVDAGYEAHGEWVAGRFLPAVATYATSLAATREGEPPEVDARARGFAAKLGAEWVARSLEELKEVRVSRSDEMEAALLARLKEWETERVAYEVAGALDALETIISEVQDGN